MAAVSTDVKMTYVSIVQQKEDEEENEDVMKKSSMELQVHVLHVLL